MKVILLHGKDTDPSQKWYPWFATEMKTVGYECIAPALPQAADPVLSEWVAEIERAKPDEETVLIGHSRGGVAVLRWLEQLAPGRRVKKVILIATNTSRHQDTAISSKSSHGFYTDDDYDFAKIQSHCDDFVVLHSYDDPQVPFSAGEHIAAGLSAKFLSFTDRGHFGRVVAEIPELLEEVVEFTARKSLLIPINPKGQIFLQDRTGFKAPPWGYFGGGIEANETPLEAVIRESQEELGIQIAPNELHYLGVSTMLWGDKKILKYLYLYPTEQESFTVFEGSGGSWVSLAEAQELLDERDRFAADAQRIEMYYHKM